MPVRYIRRAATVSPGQTGTAAASPIYMDSDDSFIKYIPASTGTTERTLADATSAQTLTNKTLTAPVINDAVVVATPVLYSADGAITLATQNAIITKAGSACLLSVAAPGVAGLRLMISSNSAFAHVITFTGATLWDGTAGANTTVTMTALQGSSITVFSASATVWVVESQNTLTSIA